MRGGILELHETRRLETIVAQEARRCAGARGRLSLLRCLLPAGHLRGSLYHRRRRLLLFVPFAHHRMAIAPPW